MTKKILVSMLAVVAVATTAGAQVAINATNFPDANFRAVVAGKTIDKDADGYLSTEEIAAVTVMDVKKSNIANLKGIEHFTALRMLGCCKNQLTSLDVSKNTALTALECYDNQLTALDVSKNTKLTYLDCSINQIKGEKMLALVNSLPKVTKGDFGVIDTKNSKEQNVCTKSQVNIAKGKGWTVVDYHGGSEQVYAGSDDPTGIAINATNFPDENFRNYLLEQSYGEDKILTAKEIAAVTEMKVSSKQIANLKGIEHFTALTYLDCGANQLTSLDVSKNTKLEYLFCYSNKLTALDVSKNTALTGLYCYINQLTALDVSKNTALTYLSCDNNQLTALDVSKNTKLTYLECSINQIKGEKMLALVNSLPKVPDGVFFVIDTGASDEQNVCTKSQVNIAKDKGWGVYAWNRGMDPQEYAGSDDPTGIAINAANFPDANFRNWLLAQSYGEDALLTTEEIASVTEISVTEKGIKNLKGIEHFIKLTKLGSNFNQLTALDVSKNTKLETLACNHNQLTALNVSNNTKLDWLYCGGNKLSTLDVSRNTALTALECYDNQLTALDVSKNTKLTYLDCSINQIKGEKMLALVNSLPKVTKGSFYVIDTKDSNEQNVITKSQVNIAKDKGWKVYDWNGGYKKEYAGSDEGIAINATNFPDANFRAVVAGKTIDKDANGYLSTEEIAAVTVMDVKKSNIANLKGIEHFTALTYLDCGANQLTSLDVSKNTALTALECYDNQLTALDVSKNTKLTYLDCSINQIKGEKMLALVNSLPKVTKGDFGVIDTKNSKEQNVCTKSQVNIAKGKGWTVVDYHGGSEQVYAGSDDTTTSIDNSRFTIDNSDDAWYSLDGKKLQGEPTKKGVYINRGKKVVK